MDIRINATPQELVTFITELQAVLSDRTTMGPDLDYDKLASAFYASPFIHITETP